jgi:hypothetical protein
MKKQSDQIARELEERMGGRYPSEETMKLLRQFDEKHEAEIVPLRQDFRNRDG